MYGDIVDEEGIEVVKRYLERGGNFIDTARAYRKSERLIAAALEALSTPRESIVLATKTKAMDPAEIRRDLETSLEKLRTNYVDLLYLHNPPEEKSEINAALGTLEDLKQEGKIRASGASIKGPNVTVSTRELCRRYIDTGMVDALQVIFSLFRQGNRDILKCARDRGVGIVARTVLESGFLTGKYAPDTRFPEGDHRNRWSPEKRDQILGLARDAMNEIPFEAPYKTLVQVAARYAVDEEGVSSVILGATKPEQVDSNCDLDALPPLNVEIRNQLTRKFSGFQELLNIDSSA